MAQAGFSQEATFHWAYASWFGTGRYSLGASETEIVTITPSWAWRTPSLSSDGERSPGIRFRFPVSVGAHEFASLDGIGEFDLDSISTVSFVPGVEAELPMSERLSLKPIGFIGRGWDIHADRSADIFRLGFRSRFTFESGDTGIALVNGLERIGYSTNDGISSALNLLYTGLDFSRPLANRKLGGDALAIHWHVMHTYYLDKLGLDVSDLSLRPDSLSSEWELGVAFGKQTVKLKLGRLSFDRVGLAYRFDASGEFSGVGIVLKSLFDR